MILADIWAWLTTTNLLIVAAWLVGVPRGLILLGILSIVFSAYTAHNEKESDEIDTKKRALAREEMIATAGWGPRMPPGRRARGVVTTVLLGSGVRG